MLNSMRGVTALAIASSVLVFAQHVTIPPKVHPEIRRLAESKSRFDVLLILKDQPQKEIVERVRIDSVLSVQAAQADYERLLRASIPDEVKLREAEARRDAIVVASRQEALRRIGVAIGAGQRSVADRLARLGATRVQRFLITNAIAAEIPASALAALEALPEIAEIAPVEEHRPLLAISVPTLGAPTFWANKITGAGQSVAVLDSGVYDSHPAFSGIKVINKVFGINGSNSPCFNDDVQSTRDMVGHGTHVAGIIASQGTKDFPSYIGVARGLGTLYNLKIGFLQKTIQGQCKGEASANPLDTIMAMQWAIENTPVRIFNYSYGRSYVADGQPVPDDDATARLFDQITDNFGLTVVVSAGNDGPAQFTLGSPGIASNIISVAAFTDRRTTSRDDDIVDYYSSRGSTSAGRRKPDLGAPGSGIYSVSNTSNGFVQKSGTSMAAPHIAGAVALLAQAGISDSLPVKAVLINSADGSGWANDAGWGYANLTTAWQHHDYLTGSLGAYSYKTFKGRSNGSFKATLVWNRHVAGNAITAATYLNQLDLLLYSRGNNTLLSSDLARLDNVKQVNTTLGGDLVVKLKANAGAFGGVDAEQYAIALSNSGFTTAHGPVLNVTCAPPAGAAAGSTFTISCDAANTGDLEAFGVSGALKLPSTFATSGSQNFGTITPGAKATRTFQVTAPAAPGSYNLGLSVASQSFDESYSASTTFNVSIGASTSQSLAIDRTSLSFNYRVGAAAPAAQTLSLSSTAGSLAFTTASTAAWLNVTPSSGTTPAALSVAIAPSGLTAGTYHGSITIRSNAAINSPLTVSITLTVDTSPQVTVTTKLTTNAVAAGTCTVPAQVTAFNPTDSQALVWYSVQSAHAGDAATLEWYAPDQTLYQSGAWTPVSSAGDWCFWGGIDVANKAAKKPGTWTVKVYWNGASLFSLTFTIRQPVSVRQEMTAASIPAGDSCPAPSAQSSFLTTDANIYSWFLVDGAATGDKAALSWYQPDGTIYRTDSWSALSSAGSWCFWTGISIAGQPPASMPGTWTAKVFWNGIPAFTMSFTISPPVLVESALISKVIPDGGSCVEPPASRTFLPGDAQSVVWFSVSKANAGDQATAEWRAPDGSVYSTVAWDPLPSGGSWCMWGWNYIAGTDMASMYGGWTVKVYWNGAPITTQSFSIVPVEVASSMTTKSIPAGTGCPSPAPAAAFVPADPYVYIWFLVNGTSAGDVARAEFISPAGDSYTTLVWDPVPYDSNRCFWGGIKLAGTSAATQPGAWTIKLSWNGLPLQDIPFQLAPAISGNSTSLITMRRYPETQSLAPGGSAQAFESLTLPEVLDRLRPYVRPGPGIGGGIAPRSGSGARPQVRPQ